MMIDALMKKPYIFILLFVSVVSLQKVKGQQNDFQCWPSVQLNLEVIRNLKLHIEEELRFSENVTQIDRQINDFGISYRINKYLKSALYYRLEANWKNPDEYEWRNGFYADLSFRYDPGRFILGYRFRMQSSKVELVGNEDPWFSGFRNRHKFGVEYDIKGIPLAPFIESELFAHAGGNEGYYLTACRIWAGLKYNLNKMHEFTLKYGIDQQLNTPDPVRAYVVTVSYALNLKLPSVE